LVVCSEFMHPQLVKLEWMVISNATLTQILTMERTGNLVIMSGSHCL
jgi:hypothetical protein